MEEYIIGLDLGTTSCKAIALSHRCEVLATAAGTNRIFSTEAGTAWQDPREVAQSAIQALKGLSDQMETGRALGICLSGAMHSLFPCDAHFDPLLPAVTWADVRAGAAAEALRQSCDASEVYRRTGCPVRYLYHPAKLRRWIDERPELQRANFSAIKDYVLYRLTGEWATDFSLASATGLMDTHRFEWDDEALALGGIHADQLPRLVSPDSLVGKITAEVARLTGLPVGLAVIAGAGDGGLANLGSGAVRTGQSVITVGTSGAVRRISAAPVFDPAERTWCYLLKPGRWFYGGATNNAGLAVQWVRELFYPDVAGAGGYERLFQDAESVPAGAEGVVMAPYFAGERNPHWDPAAKAGIYGLALGHTRKQVARAVLEGVGFCLADIWDAMGENPLPAQAVRLTGMINSRPAWAQLVADLLGVNLEGLEAADASAVGAAILGFCSLAPELSLEMMAGQSKPTAFYRPVAEHRSAYEKTIRVFRALYARGQSTWVG
jgi:gluconokinase